MPKLCQINFLIFTFRKKYEFESVFISSGTWKLEWNFSFLDFNRVKNLIDARQRYHNLLIFENQASRICSAYLSNIKFQRRRSPREEEEEEREREILRALAANLEISRRKLLR